jgi:hypothetical protein
LLEPTGQGGVIVLPDLDHFGDVNEMILDAPAAVEAGGAGFLHDLREIPAVVVSEHCGEITARPELTARVVGAADALKRRHVAGGEWMTRRLFA